MRRQVIVAFSVATIVGGVFGAACTTPQPPLECSVLAPFWAKYTLVSGTGSCSTYEGDFVDAQRYLVPGESVATVSIATARMTSVTRGLVNDEPRFDPTDPTYQKESARGTFTSLTPDKGVCTMNSWVAADQTLPEVTWESDLADGGVETNVEPSVQVKYDWSNFRLLNNPLFTSSIFTADLTITEDADGAGPGAACTATYKVDGIHAVNAFGALISCSIDEECNPNANVAAGRPTGSGLQAAVFKDGVPKCTFFTNHPDGYESSYLAEEPSHWAPGTGYPVGSKVITAGGAYIATKFGVSDESEASYHPPSGTGDAIQDGTVVWKYIGPAAASEADAWAPATSYGSTELSDGGIEYDRATSGEGEYEVVTDGISSGGPSGTGAGIVDGDTEWTFVNEGELYLPKGMCLPTLTFDELSVLK